MKSSKITTQSSFCKAQPKISSPFEKKKIHLKSGFFSAQQKLSQPEELSLLVDTQCVLDQPEPLLFLGLPIELNEAQSQLKKTAVAVRFPVLPSMETLEIAVEQTPCIIALTENLAIKKTDAVETINDPQSGAQRHLEFVGYYNSLSLQKDITAKVIVAVVDSGIDYNHLDLSNRIWRDSSNNPGYNFVANSFNPMDDDGHGTHVAGIIGAEENNSFGVAGLNGSYVKLMAVKVLDANGAGTSQTVYNGIQYAITNKANLINISLESRGVNPLLEDALLDAVAAGIVVAVATGNQSDEITETNLYAPAYVGEQVEGVMAVASVDSISAQLSFYSNYSSTYAEISAPGAETPNTTSGGILSTAPGDKWKRILGTSQATPMVTASAAMLIGYLKTNGISYTPAAIERFIKTDGSKTSSNLSNYVSGGNIINIGFLANNLKEYFINLSQDENAFSGDSTGNVCTIN